MKPTTLRLSLSYHARAVKAHDGLRLCMPVYVSDDLRELIGNQSRRSFEVVWRVTRKIRYSQELSSGAEIEVSGYIERTGTRSKEVFHAKELTVITPVARPTATDKHKAIRSVAKALKVPIGMLKPKKINKNHAQLF